MSMDITINFSEGRGGDGGGGHKGRKRGYKRRDLDKAYREGYDQGFKDGAAVEAKAEAQSEPKVYPSPSPFTSDGNQQQYAADINETYRQGYNRAVDDLGASIKDHARTPVAPSTPTLAPTPLPAMPTPDSIAQARAKFTTWPPPANEVEGNIQEGVTLQKLMQLVYVTHAGTHNDVNSAALRDDVGLLNQFRDAAGKMSADMVRQRFAYLMWLDNLRHTLCANLGDQNVPWCLLDLNADAFYALVRVASKNAYTHYASYVNNARAVVEEYGLPSFEPCVVTTLAIRLYRQDCAAYEKEWREEQERVDAPQDDEDVQHEGSVVEDLMAQRAQELAARGTQPSPFATDGTGDEHGDPVE